MISQGRGGWGEIPSSRVDNDAEASRSHTTRVFARGAGQSQAPAIGQWRANFAGGEIRNRIFSAIRKDAPDVVNLS